MGLDQGTFRALMDFIMQHKELKRCLIAGGPQLPRPFVVARDLPIQLRMVSGPNKSPQMTTIQLMAALMRPTFNDLKSGAAVSIAIMDIASLVPNRKKPTQQKRAEARIKSGTSAEPYPPNWILEVDGIRPPTSTQVEKIDRERLLATKYLYKALMYMVCKHMPTLMKMSLPNTTLKSDQYVVLDFTETGPISFQDGKLLQHPQYTHHCGEFDVMAVMYAKMYEKYDMVISSTDSDMVPFLTHYVHSCMGEQTEHTGTKNRVIWWSHLLAVPTDKFTDTVVEKKKGPKPKAADIPKTHVYFDVRLFVEGLVAVNIDPALFLRALLLGGNDYVPKNLVSFFVPFYKAPNAKGTGTGKDILTVVRNSAHLLDICVLDPDECANWLDLSGKPDQFWSPDWCMLFKDLTLKAASAEGKRTGKLRAQAEANVQRGKPTLITVIGEILGQIRSFTTRSLEDEIRNRREKHRLKVESAQDAIDARNGKRKRDAAEGVGGDGETKSKVAKTGSDSGARSAFRLLESGDVDDDGDTKMAASSKPLDTEDSSNDIDDVAIPSIEEIAHMIMWAWHYVFVNWPRVKKAPIAADREAVFLEL